MSTIRHGLREEQFRRYEDAIAKIVKNWPSSTLFSPEPPVKSVETLRARLRDACVSLSKHKWKTEIDLKAFENIFPLLVVAIDKNQVVAGPKVRVKTPTTSTQILEVLDGLVFRTNDSSAIMAILTLHHHNLLPLPSTLHSTLNPESFVDGLDVSIQAKAQQENVYLIF